MSSTSDHIATIRAALLPCPFCGAKAELFRDEEMSHNQDFWAVECLNSDCDGFRGYYPNEKTAFDQWNRRAPLDTLAAGQGEPLWTEQNVRNALGRGQSVLMTKAVNLCLRIIGHYETRHQIEAVAFAEMDAKAGQEWTPTSMELYEYPDGKKALAYTGSDGYGRAQLRYLQDTDTDTPRETIIVLPEHLRLWKLATRETTDVE